MLSFYSRVSFISKHLNVVFLPGVPPLAEREPDGAAGLRGGGDVRILGSRQRPGHHLCFSPRPRNSGEFYSSTPILRFL